ncbi:protein kinase domain-containing protein [Fimbriiglobus ruber]|uniref:non-specific serine/threonine protein kinase n=1 Tax=Fimbriiglobus ruber TaxID=1908690 RepID=A0A225D1S7_9BACT|nr:protein kinase [Fimbriiglobus ruber]OWK35560.1 Serine/threonine protein kinase PrkC, regulator of stationary phase [Fimbriiglobus ruber]
MPTDPARAQALFVASAEIADRAARVAFLDDACGSDLGLKVRVEALLRAHDQSDSLLDTPLVAPQTFAQDKDIAPTGGTSTVAGTPGGAENDEIPLGFLAPSARPDSLGRIGHYDILQVLGRGGFGIVLRAFDDLLQRVVALKVLAPALAATSPARKRFLREARSSAAVRHENVVQVHVVEEQPLPYLVMEFIPGETLQQRLDRTGPLETDEIVRLGRQIAAGLAAAHATGLIHRDIKPCNILIEAGAHERAKITDFGLARTADDASLTQSGLLAGTPMYMAPEQAAGEKLDHRADLFSLGSVLYVMATGRPPFRAASTFAVLKRVVEDYPRPIRDVIPEVPQWLCDIISRLHAKKPDERFATAGEVAELLERFSAKSQRPGNDEHRPTSTPPAARAAPPAGADRPTAPPAQPPRFRPRLWTLVAVVFLLSIGSLGVAEATGVSDVHGTVVRLFSPEGTLVVEVDDPEVSVRIDGPELVITGAGVKEIRLKPGQYTVEARKDGKVVSQELVTVTKDGRQIVRVSRESQPLAKEKDVVPTIADPDRRGAEYAFSIGASVHVNGEGEKIESAAGLPRGSFRLTEVDASDNKQVTDAGLAHFRGCKHVTYLSLYRTEVTDAGLAHFKDCKDLTALNLRETPTSDAGMAHFEHCKNLQYLELLNTQVTDAGLAHFHDCKKLRYLSLFNTHVTDAGMAYFEGCKDLTDLVLNGTNVTDAGLSRFKNCKELAQLQLSNTPVSNAGLIHFKDFKKLTVLRIEGTKITDLSIIKGAPLKALCCDFQPERDAEILRSIKTLESINDKPVKEFWKDVDANK